MQRLDGVIDGSRVRSADDLKRYSLFFDKIHLLKLRGFQQFHEMLYKSETRDLRRTKAELKYLERQDVVARIDENACIDLIRKITAHAPSERFDEILTLPTRLANSIIK